MKKTMILIFVVAFTATVGAAQAVRKCFSNSGLKDKHTVFLTLDGNRVSGEFVVETEYESSKSYAFTGTNQKNVLTVSFTGNTVPYQLPPGTKKGNWTLKTADGAEALLIKIYGRNYETNKFATYSATYEACEPGYEVLARKATRVSFAKGAKSATVKVALRSQSDRAAFWLKLGKGQKFSVTAPACGVSFFYPDKKPYEEGTAIDVWATDALPQSGDYLFVISPAGEPGDCSVKFSTE